jgi:hypothetical protein
MKMPANSIRCPLNMQHAGTFAVSATHRDVCAVSSMGEIVTPSLEEGIGGIAGTGNSESCWKSRRLSRERTRSEHWDRFWGLITGAPSRTGSHTPAPWPEEEGEPERSSRFDSGETVARASRRVPEEVGGVISFRTDVCGPVDSAAG